MKSNILYLNINSNLGGGERSLLEEVKNLNKNKLNPIAGLFCKGPLIKELKKEKINYKIFQISKKLLKQSKEKINLSLILKSPFFLIRLSKTIKEIKEYIEKNKIKLVISNSFKTHIFTYFLKRSNESLKIIWHYRERLPENPKLKKIILFLAKKIPNKIITNSDYIKNQFIINNIPDKKVIVDYPKFNLKKITSFIKKDCRKSFNLKKNDFAIGCLGALVPWKGQEYLIKAAKILKDKIPNLKVFIVGDEIYDTKSEGSKKYLINLTKKLNLINIINFTGFLKEPYKILNSLDIVVHTSVKPEPFGRVIIESMLCGKPVIATNMGGPLEIIKNNKTGMLIPPKDQKILAENILSLNRNSKKRRMIAEKGREYAISHFCKKNRNINLQYLVKNYFNRYK